MSTNDQDYSKGVANQRYPDICPNCGYNADNQTTCCIKFTNVKSDLAKLREENERYRKALKKIVNLTSKDHVPNNCTYDSFGACHCEQIIAKQALEGKGEDGE